MDERDVLRALELSNQALNKVCSVEKTLDLHMSWHREQVLSLNSSDQAIRADLKAGFSELRAMLAEHTVAEQGWRESDSRRWITLSWAVVGALLGLAFTLIGYIWVSTVG